MNMNKIKLVGLLLLIVLFTLSMTACDNNSSQLSDISDNGELIVKANNESIIEYFQSMNSNTNDMNLQNTIEAYDKRLSTGFCTTHRMMLSLAQNGLAELAYDLLFTERIPSWFYMINQGATTMWERWDGYVEGRGFQSKSMNSFNHYSFGAIGEFLYKMILGINYDPANPGYKDIIIRPKFDKRLSWVKGYYESIYGPIEVSWIYKKERIEISISVTVNTTAQFQVETKFEVKMDPSDHRDLKIIKENENLISISLESGNYIFVLEKNKM